MRRPVSQTRPFEASPVVVLSVYAEADLAHVAHKLHRSEWDVRELMRTQVSLHGDGLPTDRLLFDRWQAVVAKVDVTYDIFPDAIMIVAMSA